MHFLKPFLVTWACLAQVSLAGVAFTKWPTTVYTGRPATMTWNGDPNAPATITLRQGAANDLKTLKVLTTQAGGGSFTWVPEESLPEGSDYAFQIEQNGSINYSGLVKLAHQPGKEPPPSASKKTPLPSDTSSLPLSDTMHGVQKGNNGHIPVLNSTSARLNMTSSKSTTSSTSSDGTSFRYVSPEMLLGGLAVIIYFAA
ncbi:hypothetical protein BJY01DRAFT_252899 [Aspergillus pseudoustus]|uniref:Yeast cell wall synthesis Kre9/Knh1-like N-terminal domain-containing protein n=1 Tax=Aspergillus pseudoustus TaxID=1810923 RepID=A0ABR4J6J6_9EURO